jgi:hypothetical protein
MEHYESTADPPYWMLTPTKPKLKLPAVDLDTPKPRFRSGLPHFQPVLRMIADL